MRFWLALYVWYFVPPPASVWLVLALIFCRRYGTALDLPKDSVGIDADTSPLANRCSKIPRGPL